MLIDFGTVRDAMKDPKLGGSTIAGTYGYMAPEQYEGRATPATDLYGLGALALALLSREDPSTMMRHGVKLDWRSRVSVSPAFSALLEDLLAPDAQARPQRARQVLNRVQRIRRGEGEVPRRPTGPPLEQPYPRGAAKNSRVKLIAGMAGGMSAVLALVILLAVGSNRSTPAKIGPRPHGAYTDYGYPEEIEAWCSTRNLPRACYRWGQLLMVQQRDQEAIAHYEKACDRLNGAACNELGELYQHGSHVSKSAEKAAAYFKAACAGGVESACARLH